MNYGNARINRTHTTVTVLRLFIAVAPESLDGATIRRTTGIKAGTIYPMLSRLEKIGWLKSTWEDIDPSKVGRPRRKEYAMTTEGLSGGTEMIEVDS